MEKMEQVENGVEQKIIRKKRGGKKDKPVNVRIATAAKILVSREKKTYIYVIYVTENLIGHMK